jgi:hypothetical protein
VTNRICAPLSPQMSQMKVLDFILFNSPAQIANLLDEGNKRKPNCHRILRRQLRLLARFFDVADVEVGRPDTVLPISFLKFHWAGSGKTGHSHWARFRKTTAMEFDTRDFVQRLGGEITFATMRAGDDRHVFND